MIPAFTGIVQATVEAAINGGVAAVVTVVLTSWLQRREVEQERMQQHTRTTESTVSGVDSEVVQSESPDAPDAPATPRRLSPLGLGATVFVVVFSIFLCLYFLLLGPEKPIDGELQVSAAVTSLDSVFTDSGNPLLFEVPVSKLRTDEGGMLEIQVDEGTELREADVVLIVEKATPFRCGLFRVSSVSVDSTYELRRFRGINFKIRLTREVGEYTFLRIPFFESITVDPSLESPVLTAEGTMFLGLLVARDFPTELSIDMNGKGFKGGASLGDDGEGTYPGGGGAKPDESHTYSDHSDGKPRFAGGGGGGSGAGGSNSGRGQPGGSGGSGAKGYNGKTKTDNDVLEGGAGGIAAVSTFSDDVTTVKYNLLPGSGGGSGASGATGGGKNDKYHTASGGNGGNGGLAGGAGGGAVFVAAETFNSPVCADGASGDPGSGGQWGEKSANNDPAPGGGGGGAGGGAGGSILIITESGALSPQMLSVSGGAGGAGGGGGGSGAQAGAKGGDGGEGFYSTVTPPQGLWSRLWSWLRS